MNFFTFALSVILTHSLPLVLASLAQLFSLAFQLHVTRIITTMIIIITIIINNTCNLTIKSMLKFVLTTTLLR